MRHRPWFTTNRPIQTSPQTLLYVEEDIVTGTTTGTIADVAQSVPHGTTLIFFKVCRHVMR